MYVHLPAHANARPGAVLGAHGRPAPTVPRRRDLLPYGGDGDPDMLRSWTISRAS